MDKKQHIDDFFRDKLGNHSMEYVPEHWQMMKSALDSIPKTPKSGLKNNLTNILLMVSALVIVGFSFYVYSLSEKLNNTSTDRGQIASLQSPAVDHSTLRQLTDEPRVNQPEPTRNPLALNKHPKNQSVKNQNVQSIQQPIRNNTRSDQPDAQATATHSNSNNGDKTNPANSGTLNEKTTEVSVNTSIVTEPTVQQLKYTTRYDGLSESESPIPAEDGLADGNISDDYQAMIAKTEGKNRKASRPARVKMAQADKLASKDPNPDYKVALVNNIIVNPAFSGFNQQHTFNLGVLTHKPLFKPSNDFTAPFEYGIAYDFCFGKNRNYGIGVNYRRFVGGAEGSLDIDLTFAYRFAFGKHHRLRFGISGSYYAYGINFADLTFGDMINDRSGFVFNSQETTPQHSIRNNFDLGFGVMYSWKSLYAGISAIHLTSPEIGLLGESRLPREYILSTGYGVNISKRLDVLPSVELRYNEKLFLVSPSLLCSYRRWLLFGVESPNCTSAGLVLGVNFYDTFILNLRAGVPFRSDIRRGFGFIDYAGANMRVQFGKRR